MPNYAFGTMWLELPSENAEKFIGLFLSSNALVNDESKRHFYRSTLVSFDMQKTFDNACELVVSFTSAWSLWDCLIEGSSIDKNGNYVILKDACDELNVSVLAAVGEEPMEGVKEKIRYFRGEEILYEKIDIPCKRDCGEWEEWRTEMEL